MKKSDPQQMKKKCDAIEDLLKIDMEKHVVFQYVGEKVMLDVYKGPKSNKYFGWLTVYLGDEVYVEFPLVEVTDKGIRASFYCLEQNLQIFIPYEGITIL